MDPDIFVAPALVIPAAEIRYTTSRSGGPGGQHVNKTSSRVTLHWDVGNSKALDDEQRSRVLVKLAGRVTDEGILYLHVDTERSQHANKAIARDRLARLVGWALRKPKKRVATRVPAKARRRRVEDKRKHGVAKRLRKQPSDAD